MARATELCLDLSHPTARLGDGPSSVRRLRRGTRLIVFHACRSAFLKVWIGWLRKYSASGRGHRGRGRRWAPFVLPRRGRGAAAEVVFFNEPEWDEDRLACPGDGGEPALSFDSSWSGALLLLWSMSTPSRSCAQLAGGIVRRDARCSLRSLARTAPHRGLPRTAEIERRADGWR